ncbi:MAG TPA: NAD(P)(+) transhydrogenase (Re/Si-specific) subunit beta [Candidatus Deferrimicrobium sp.]|nr:NAD(P)(+) transhydrogenase (Re/Si-specific) subunit beta [Candidatus Deferrimicrobium sp.]
MRENIVQYTYLAAGLSFVFAIKWMTSPTTARRGVLAGELGMVLAVVGTFVRPEVTQFTWIVVGLMAGAAIGVPLAAFVPMTAMPQRTALSHAFGATAATLVGVAEYIIRQPHLDRFTTVVLGIEVLLGGLTVTGSLMAFAKLQEIIRGRPVVYRGQNVVNLSILAIALAGIAWLAVDPSMVVVFGVVVAAAVIFGVLLIVPIGGADMPTVIALLNSYAGLSAVAMGFALDNKVLEIAGALDGSSGFILAVVMCRAMNRNFRNILFGAFGQVTTSSSKAAEEDDRPVRSGTSIDGAAILDGARMVVIIPGYGMAVAQAQHKVAELSDALERNGTQVRFAIHPVAGRMPGHMNVLLAEADVPYDHMVELDEANELLSRADVAIVIGANDVTNPAAKNEPGSPVYGMPILDVDSAGSVLVIKRSMAPGFAGIGNELYYLPNTTMLFGDAKHVVGALVSDLGGSG